MDKVFEYSELSSAKKEILSQLHDYGFVVIRGVPDVVETIDAFRKSALDFISLPSEQKTRCTPEDFFAYGWSFGEEIFSGRRDSFKGSYYADLPENDHNVWPGFDTESFSGEQFKENYLNLGKLVSETGQHILRCIGYNLDNYVNKMRMLHYGAVTTETDDSSPYWCGLHKDHGYFTGLVPAFYFKDGQPTPKPENTGLHIRGQSVTIPDDCLAFQVGETLELASNGEVTATEHDVRKAFGCERLTFATFISPEDGYVINSNVTHNDRYTGPMTFKEFGDASYKKYYS